MGEQEIGLYSAAVAPRLLAFIMEELLTGVPGSGQAETLGPDDNLLMSGLIDSHAVVELVAFIEGEFGVAVNPGDVTIKNFRTVNTIAAYVEQRRSGAAG
jgi:acyl carrier protein